MALCRTFIASRMGIDPADKRLRFLADARATAKSFEEYRRKEQENEGVSSSRPVSSSQSSANDGALLSGLLLCFPFEAFAGSSPFLSLADSASLSISLKLPQEPLLSNGKWEKSSSAVRWSFPPGNRPLATICYATWCKVDAKFQKDHFGKVVLDGLALVRYCLWRGGLTAAEGRQWDDFLNSVKPDSAKRQLEAFLTAHRLPTTQPARTEPSSTDPEQPPSYLGQGADMILPLESQ